MKFIHCADLHLDSKMEGLPLDKSKIRREEILRTFEKLCDYATEIGAKAVIIAGDMFDTSKVSLKTRARVLQAIISNSSVDFLYLSGNHDEDNFISSLEVIPDNLKVFSDEWTSFSYSGVVISGVKFTPYNTKSIYDTLNLKEQEVNIVVMHGQTADYKSIDKAETISIPLLKNKNIDYLALGHIHEHVEQQIDLRGKYAYAGCLEGRGFDETGEKGFVLIDVEDGKVNTQFVKCALRSLAVFEYSVDNVNDFITAKNEIISVLKSRLPQTSLIKVVLKGQRNTDFDIDVLGLTSRLNEEFFFAKVYDKTEIKVDSADYEMDKSVRGEFVRAVWESDLSSELKSKIITCGLNALKGEDF